MADQDQAQQPHELRILTHPLGQLNVFKHEESFAVFDDTGNIEADSTSPLGLYYKDTRYLSQWAAMIEGGQMKLLNRDMDDLNTNLVSHLTCQKFIDTAGVEVPDSTVYMRREKFLYQGALYEKMTIENYAPNAVNLKLVVAFHADFVDIFQARGIDRKMQGMSRETSAGEDYVMLGYTGLDHAKRTSLIRVSRPADRVSHDRFEFQIVLPHGQSETLYFCAGRDQGPISEDSFNAGRAALAEMMTGRAAQWTTIQTGDRRLDRWLERSRNGLCLLLTDFATGPYPFAGIPWFCVPFGRDAIITAFQTLWTNPEIARGVLGFLAENQAHSYSDVSDAEPGKILHEMRQGEMAATGEVPFAKYYGSIDSTPLFVMLAGAYARHTGDMELIGRIWPAIEEALAWLEREGDADKGGFLSYKRKIASGLSNQGWKDSEDSVMHADGTLLESPIALCEVQGYAYAAWIAAADLADMSGKTATAERYRARADTLYKHFNDVFWSEEMGCYALALDADEKPALVKSSNNGHLLWTGIVPKERAGRVVAMLMEPDMLSGWGVRTLTMDAVRYNPMSYHNGSIWPHDTAIAAAGMGRYGYYEQATKVFHEIFGSARHMRGLLLPELYCGFPKAGAFGPAKYPAACILQAWALGAPFMALQGALGLNYDGQSGQFAIANKTFAQDVRIASARPVKRMAA